MTAQIIPLVRPRDIRLRAHVEFTQFGVTLAGRVEGISHDGPMRYDVRLDNGTLIPNVPERAIGAVTATNKLSAIGQK